MQSETEAQQALIEQCREALWCSTVDYLSLWHRSGTEWDTIVAIAALAMAGQSTRKEAVLLSGLAKDEGWPAVMFMIGSAMRQSETAAIATAKES